jgi:hypothetical protein
MKTLPLRLLVVAALFGTAFLVLGFLYPDSQYWSALAIECLSLIVGIAIINNLLSRHEQQRWAAADALVAQLLSDFATQSLVQIGNASPWRRVSLSDFMVSHGGGGVVHWAAEVLEPGLLEGVRGADSTARKGIASAAEQISTHAERLLMVVGPRLEPVDLQALLAVTKLCAEVLWPSRAMPELIDTTMDGHIAKNAELTRVWNTTFSAMAGPSLKRLSETLRALGTSRANAIVPAG